MRGDFRQTAPALIGLLAALGVSLLIANADLRWVRFYADSAPIIQQAAQPEGANGRIHYRGEWAYRSAMETIGALYWNPGTPTAPGDAIVRRRGVREWPVKANPELFEIPLLKLEPNTGAPPFSVMDPTGQAGYYTSAWGLLPLGILSEEPERIEVTRLEPQHLFYNEQDPFRPRRVKELHRTEGDLPLEGWRLGERREIGKASRLELRWKPKGRSALRKVEAKFTPTKGPTLTLTSEGEPTGEEARWEAFNFRWPRETHLPGFYELDLRWTDADGGIAEARLAEKVHVESYVDRMDGEEAEHPLVRADERASTGYRVVGVMGPEFRWKVQRPNRIVALAITSNLAYGAGLMQGETAGELRIIPAGGEAPIVLPIRAGIETAEWAADRPDVAPTIGHSKPSARTAFDGGSFEGARFLGYDYHARWELAEEVSVAEIALVMKRDAILQVRPLLLLERR